MLAPSAGVGGREFYCGVPFPASIVPCLHTTGKKNKRGIFLCLVIQKKTISWPCMVAFLKAVDQLADDPPVLWRKKGVFSADLRQLHLGALSAEQIVGAEMTMPLWEKSFVFGTIDAITKKEEAFGVRQITEQMLQGYAAFLRAEERSAATIEKYLRYAGAFAVWLGDRKLTKEAVAAWKAELTHLGHAPVSVNAALSALNGLFRYLGREDCRVRFLKVQRRLFRDPSRELTREEYERLVRAAYDLGKTRLALLIETICATGIRVSEVRFVTVEAVEAGRVDVAMKGKIRTILLPGKLCRKLRKYARAQGIRSGEIFCTRSGRPMTRGQIWAEMKRICGAAGVESSKVFPHNLRHLFARVFYKVCRDVVKLADVLGHSSIETTRIYLIATGQEHVRQLERLRLVI